jgi:hypothetical protein
MRSGVTGLGPALNSHHEAGARGLWAEATERSGETLDTDLDDGIVESKREAHEGRRASIHGRGFRGHDRDSFPNL